MTLKKMQLTEQAHDFFVDSIICCKILGASNADEKESLEYLEPLNKQLEHLEGQ